MMHPGCSGGGGGVSNRTFELPAAFAGKSAKIVILLFAGLFVMLKGALAAPGCDRVRPVFGSG